MCGFAGFINSYKFDLDYKNILEKMGNSINHRGPDDNGQWYDDVSGIGLAHRRLSIIDLTNNGHQPMVCNQNQYVLVYNGEIYNHKSLRDELKKEGREIFWKGNGDTETLFNSLIHWGIKKTLNKCHGMFAFAFWDNKKKILSLARDRIGEKPIYYGFNNIDGKKVFLFGSELKSIENFKYFNKEIDRQSLGLFFKYGNIPSPSTIYNNFYKLKPGYIATISAKNLNIKYENYWSLNSTVTQSKNNVFNGTQLEAANSLDDLLKKVLSKQMIADVKLGAFLSGGIDSSLIVSLMQSISTNQIQTFSIGFNEKKLNEAVLAKQISNHLGTEHTELYITKSDLLKTLPLIQDIYDEPFADSSQIPTYFVSKLAKENVKVVLSGDGGDEIFGGYNRYQFIQKNWKLISSIPLDLRKIIYQIYDKIPLFLLDFIINTVLRKQIYNVEGTLNKVFKIIKSNNINEAYSYLISIQSNSNKIVKNIDNPKIDILNSCDKFSNYHFSELMMIEDTKNYLPNDILTKIDRAAMSVSLETRIPFLDHKIIEYAWSLPLNYKINNENGVYETKHILKNILLKYLPKKLIKRKKMGFAIPLSSWLKNELRDWSEDLLNEKHIKNAGYLDYKFVNKQWKDFLRGNSGLDNQIWSILMFQSWLNR